MDINVLTTSYQVEKRDWYLGTADQPGFTRNVKVDVSAFTSGTHYPNGFIPSGVPVGIITAQSSAALTVVGPYDDSATGTGREVCLGLLFGNVKVPDLLDLTKDAAGAVLCAFAPVQLSKLPITLDAAGQADLTRLYFVA
jgi:hypothetical protein